jgi:hypothetical protein
MSDCFYGVAAGNPAGRLIYRLLGATQSIEDAGVPRQKRMSRQWALAAMSMRPESAGSCSKAGQEEGPGEVVAGA